MVERNEDSEDKDSAERDRERGLQANKTGVERNQRKKTRSDKPEEESIQGDTDGIGRLKNKE